MTSVTSALGRAHAATAASSATALATLTSAGHRERVRRGARARTPQHLSSNGNLRPRRLRGDRRRGSAVMTCHQRNPLRATGWGQAMACSSGTHEYNGGSRSDELPRIPGQIGDIDKTPGLGRGCGKVVVRSQTGSELAPQTLQSRQRLPSPPAVEGPALNPPRNCYGLEIRRHSVPELPQHTFNRDINVRGAATPLHNP